jgi:hypothetical protein
VAQIGGHGVAGATTEEPTRSLERVNANDHISIRVKRRTLELAGTRPQKLSVQLSGSALVALANWLLPDSAYSAASEAASYHEDSHRPLSFSKFQAATILTIATTGAMLFCRAESLQSTIGFRRRATLSPDFNTDGRPKLLITSAQFLVSTTLEVAAHCSVGI